MKKIHAKTKTKGRALGYTPAKSHPADTWVLYAAFGGIAALTAYLTRREGRA